MRDKNTKSKFQLDVRFAMASVLATALAFTCGAMQAETCTTQSQMKQPERDLIAQSARTIAAKVEDNDAAAVRAQSLPDFAKDFSGMTTLLRDTSASIKGATLVVDQVYLLDASSLKTLGDGTNQDAQFFCSLNQSPAEAEFSIPALPPGKYAFAVVLAKGGKTPTRLSFLLKQDATTAAGAQGQGWLMAGFYPKPLTAAGHDGLWYWTQGRDLVKEKQLWSAYLYYLQAQSLLQPAGFVSSTHLEKLRKESSSSAPPALSVGISTDVPLVVPAPKTAAVGPHDYRFTSLSTDDSLGGDKVDIVLHLAPEPPAEPAATGAATKQPAKAPELSPRERNDGAMVAFLAAYPELRSNFHGVWVFADAPGKNAFVTEQAMSNIH